ncbi:MAG: T9SS type A sorting domain-containing protein [Chitinophagaceae bacterium]|nr:T9SS type A sorting domain-containing protein [Chitinophagaceae bacterium]
MNWPLLTAFFAVVAAAPMVAYTQPSTENYAYAVTSNVKGDYQWTEVKEIDLNTGNILRNVYENAKGNYKMFNARTGQEIHATPPDSQSPFSGLSAACAYHKETNRLYYASMFINQLRYLDLNSPTPQVYIFDNEPLGGSNDMSIEANHFTRMVIGPDGNGYALNNDGKRFIKFTTGENPVITNLGQLTNAPENGAVSISDANTSWGGDMIADVSGNLYIISANNYLFKIDVQARTAKYITKIKNLPVGFTTNGAAVDNKGNLTLSSANFITAYYKIDPITWEATAITNNDLLYNTSDLANENLLLQTDLVVLSKDDPQSRPTRDREEKVTIYPNPAKPNQPIQVSFKNKGRGKYHVLFADFNGRVISAQQVNVDGASVLSRIPLDLSLAKGLYIVKILDPQNQLLVLKKVIVE